MVHPALSFMWIEMNSFILFRCASGGSTSTNHMRAAMCGVRVHPRTSNTFLRNKLCAQ